MHLADYISAIEPPLLVVGRDVATDSGNLIDLLCLDGAGDVVVVECKRREAPRRLTARVLGHDAWVADLSSERIVSLAQAYLGSDVLEEAFRRRFGWEVPARLNSAHRVLIVGSSDDQGLKRLITDLARTHGVSGEALTFRVFSEPGGSKSVLAYSLTGPSPLDPRDDTRAPAGASEGGLVCASSRANPPDRPSPQGDAQVDAGVPPSTETESFTFAITEIMGLKERANRAAREAFGLGPDGTLLDPTSVVRAFDCLSLRADRTLRAILVGDDLGYESRIFALPSTAMLELEDLLKSVSTQADWQHVFAVEPFLLPAEWTWRFMEAVEGDGGPWSYLCASLLLRELTDFAAVWHACLTHDWMAHLILPGWPPPSRMEMEGRPTRVPTQFLREEDRRPEHEVTEPWWERLEWVGPRPAPPQVHVGAREVVAEFYTYRPPFYDPEEVWRHIDTYQVGSYDAVTVKTKVASGKSGPRIRI